MAGLLDLVRQELNGPAIQQLSDHIGANPAQTQSAVSAALPALLGSMAQTAQQPGGEDTIHQAAQEHAGWLGNLSGLLGQAPADAAAPNTGLLDRLLGQRQTEVQNNVSQASGLGSDQTKRILMVLAPLALAALARQRQEAQGQGAGSGGIAQMLQQAHGTAQQQSGLGGMLGQLFAH